MEVKTTKLYLYLARRDKKGVQVLAVFQGPPKTCRIDDIKSLGLERSIEELLQAYIHQNRMYWEAWIEPAKSYTELKDRMAKRGYKDMPMSSTPVADLDRTASVNTSKLNQRKTMIKKGG